jgi:hypothetical protein
MGYKTNSDFNKALPAETAKLFKVVGMKKRTSLKLVWPKWGVVDFQNLSVARATQLVNMKFPFLSPLQPPKKTTDKGE